jgi:hypothetical protein
LASQAAWNAFLKFWGYSEGRGMSPTTFTAERSDGRTLIAGFGGNFATGRGSAALEELDARSQHDPSKNLATAPKGHSSETYEDPEARVDNLGDPISPAGGSATMRMGEKLRAEAIAETYVKTFEKRKIGRQWVVFIDGEEATRFNKESAADARLKMLRDAHKRETKPENSVSEVMSEAPSPAVFDGELRGLDEQKLTASDDKILDEIRKEICADGIPIEEEQND